MDENSNVDLYEMPMWFLGWSKFLKTILYVHCTVVGSIRLPGQIYNQLKTKEGFLSLFLSDICCKVDNES